MLQAGSRRRDDGLIAVVPGDAVPVGVSREMQRDADLRQEVPDLDTVLPEPAAAGPLGAAGRLLGRRCDSRIRVVWWLRRERLLQAYSAVLTVT